MMDKLNKKKKEQNYFKYRDTHKMMTTPIKVAIGLESLKLIAGVKL